MVISLGEMENVALVNKKIHRNVLLFLDSNDILCAERVSEDNNLSTNVHIKSNYVLSTGTFILKVPFLSCILKS